MYFHFWEQLRFLKRNGISVILLNSENQQKINIAEIRINFKILYVTCDTVIES